MKMLKNTLFAGIKAKNKDSYLYQNNRPYMANMGYFDTNAPIEYPMHPKSRIDTNSFAPSGENAPIFTYTL